MTYPKYIETIFHSIGRDHPDHFEERKDENGNNICISQPYHGLHNDDIKHIIEICDKNNIEFDIMPSDHFPLGRTIMIEWKQKK
jgi:putative aminopeptidase FrvX